MLVAVIGIEADLPEPPVVSRNIEMLQAFREAQTNAEAYQTHHSETTRKVVMNLETRVKMKRGKRTMTRFTRKMGWSFPN